MTRDEATHRLVLHQDESGVWASLFPLDASPYTRTVATFEVSPSQPLPRIAPGSPVRVAGDLFGEEPPLVFADETVVRGASKAATDGPHGSRIFAERGDVIAHPSVLGPSPDWRYRQPVSTDDVTTRQQRWREATTAFWTLAGVCAVFAGVACWAVITDRASFGVRFFLGAPVGVATIAQGRRARRQRAAFRAAQQLLDRPARPMRMTIDWLAGDGHGPVAMAVLRDNDGVIRVPVFNLAPDTSDDVEVEVRQDRRTNAIVIDYEGRLLWPQGPPT